MSRSRTSGLSFGHFRKRFLAVARLAHHLDVGHELEQSAYALADQGLVVDENDPDHAPCGAPEGSQASTVKP